MMFLSNLPLLNYLQSEKNQYEYRLLPRNEEWIRTGAERPFATYTNLNSGSYTFEVRGSNNDGKWNKEAVQLNMLISPPWFKTWWAYSIYGFSIFGILWLIRRFEIARQQLRYQLEIENVRAEKLQEMNEVKSPLFHQYIARISDTINFDAGTGKGPDEECQCSSATLSRTFT